MLRKKIAVMLGTLCLAVTQNMFAHNCPSGATDIGPGSSAGARLLVAGVPTAIPPEGVGVCSMVRLGGTIRYDAQGTFGINVAFEGGTMRIFTVDSVGAQIPGLDVDVTPTGGVPLIGPIECSPIQSLNSKTVDFDIAAYIAAHPLPPDRIIRFRFLYGPAGTIAHTEPHQLNVVTKGDGIQVLVAPAPTCSVGPNQRVCVGSSATFTVTPGGQGPFTFCWKKNCSSTPETTGCLNTTPTLSFPVTTAADAGCYKVTVADEFGCTTVCSNTLTIVGPPSCVISPGTASTCANPVTKLPGETQQFCVTANAGTSGNAADLRTTVTKNGAAFAGPFSGAGPHCFNAIAPSAGACDVYVATVVDSSVNGACTSTCQAALKGICTPGVRITKEIACVGCDGNCTAFAKTATGVKRADNTQCPSFCYRIQVFNTGTCDLSNVVVTDPDLDLSSCNFPTTLAVGASTAPCVVRRNNLCNNDVNTVTVRAVGVGADAASANVTDSASATNIVLSLDIECDKLVSINGAAPVRAPACTTTGPNNIDYIIVVRNLGQVPVIATVTDPILGVNTQVSVAAGATSRVTNSVVLPCTNLVNTATVTAVTDVSIAGVCTDCYGINLHVSETTSCSAEICCQPPQVGNCRVTGGGKQDQVGQRGGKVINVDPRHAARYVTHGGQVGAPVGEKTEFTACSPCIKGEWTHVRHIAPGLDGNFHARHFDSINCACLPCPESPGSGVTVGGLCNPGDRVCGPEPRRAPDNKICFSGIGDYTVTNGRRTPQSVAFRVDIEDHSEPGGAGPKGNKRLPADRYRIRIWMLGSSTTKSKPCDDTSSLALRRAIACSDATTALEDGVVTPGTTTTPLGTASFGVRAPDYDDGGELDRGNHQIHPQIKHCP